MWRYYWYYFEIIDDYQIQLYYFFHRIATANVIKKGKYVLQRDSNPQPLSILAKWSSGRLRTKWLRFESRCSHINFRIHACFEQGVPWHSGNYRVWFHSETRTWHGKNIQLKIRTIISVNRDMLINPRRYKRLTISLWLLNHDNLFSGGWWLAASS